MQTVSVRFFKELLATRKDRALQRVEFFGIDEPEIASAVGELVGTDPNKQWSFQGQLYGAALCLPAQQRYSSLTELQVCADHKDQVLFATLLTLIPTTRSFSMDFTTDVCMNVKRLRGASCASCLFVIEPMSVIEC